MRTMVIHLMVALTLLGTVPEVVLAAGSPAADVAANSCRCTAAAVTNQTIEVKNVYPEDVYAHVNTFVQGCIGAAGYQFLECKISYKSTTNPVVSLSDGWKFEKAEAALVTTWLEGLKAILITPPPASTPLPENVNKSQSTPLPEDKVDESDISIVPPNCRGAAYVAGTDKATVCGLSAVEDLIVRIIKIILGLSGSLALLMFVYGGTMYIVAGGMPSMAAKGKSAMTYAVIGLTIVLCARLILSSVLRALVKG